jgi:hypothetical protein
MNCPAKRVDFQPIVRTTLPNLLWSHASESLKLLRQVTLTGETHLQCNVSDKRSLTPKGVSPNRFLQASVLPVPLAVESRIGEVKFL